MATRPQTRLSAGALALMLALSQPIGAMAQTPPGDSPARSTRRGTVTKCTEAAPCAAPRTHTKPGKIAPSAAAVRAFREKHPCPTTAHVSGACPGYVVNHIEPPCKGGLDVPSNLQWQTHTSANRQDQTACR